MNVSAESAVLMNADTGAILYEKGIHQRRFPSSTTKLGVALYVMEKTGGVLDRKVVVSREAVTAVAAKERQAVDSSHPPYRLEWDGTSIGLRAGDRCSLNTLLHGALIASGNDAANALVEAVSGSFAQFVSDLQSYFDRHGIRETQFLNPHGLHHPDHWTTAYDLALMARLVLQEPLLRSIVQMTRYEHGDFGSRSLPPFVQTNRLLRPGPYFYPYAIGVKTGFVGAGGYSLVSAAKKGDRTLIGVVLGCPDREARFKDTIRLFEAAFAETKVTRTLFPPGQDLFTRSVRGARGPLKAVLSHPLVMEYYPAEAPKWVAEVHWKPCSLPIEEGDVVGDVHCTDGTGNVLATSPLVATHALHPTVWAYGVTLFRRYSLGVLLLGLMMTGWVYLVKQQQKIMKR